VLASSDHITYHDENTIFKVRKVLGKYVCGKQAITDCILELQNEGIYFRERDEEAMKEDASEAEG
jgi:hypothetical protein